MIAGLHARVEKVFDETPLRGQLQCFQVRGTRPITSMLGIEVGLVESQGVADEDQASGGRSWRCVCLQAQGAQSQGEGSPATEKGFAAERFHRVSPFITWISTFVIRSAMPSREGSSGIMARNAILSWRVGSAPLA